METKQLFRLCPPLRPLGAGLHIPVAREPSVFTSTVTERRLLSYCRVLSTIRAGDVEALEALLASEAAESAKGQPEVASASKALQAAKDRTDKEAEAAR